MYRKSILSVIVLFMLVIFAACSTAAPQAAQESEAADAPTEAPVEEAQPTEAPVEEESGETTGESASEGDAEASYTVDTEASTLEWYGDKPIGASESGTVQITEGELSFNGSELVDGSFTIDMTTITPTSQSGNMLTMLTDHLLSDDFFGVETYPTATSKM